MSNNTNNQDDFGDLDVGFADFTDCVSPAVMTMCQVMPMYPPVDVIIQSETEVEKKPSNDMTTLTQVNGSDDEKEVHDVIEYHDMDQKVDVPPPSEGLFLEEFDSPMEFDIDQKPDFYNYTQQQHPIPNYRVDVYDTTNMHQALVSPICEAPSQLLDVDLSFPPSPASTIFSYDEPINNNENDRRPIRSRKMSVKDGKIPKTQDKPYRTRRTKAEMESMTDKQRSELKKEQNRINAKNLVGRKNEERDELISMIPELEKKLEEMKRKNHAQKEGLEYAYNEIIFPTYDNNSPFGLPGEFAGTLETATTQVPIEDGGNLEILQAELDDATKKFEQLEFNHKKVKPNTFASQKSRAKGNLARASGKFETTKLRMNIVSEEIIWNELAKLASVLNPYLREQHLEELPQNEICVDLKQFDPS